MGELSNALQYLIRAKENVKNGEDDELNLWLARAKLEVFLAKLVLQHGLEERTPPKFKGKVELNAETLERLVVELSSAIEAYQSGMVEEAFKTCWLVREVLTKLL